MKRYDKAEERSRRSGTVSASDGERLKPIDVYSEQASLAAAGFSPCGLAQTWTRCPACGQLMGRFRGGMPGMKWYNTDKQVTVLAETVDETMLWCRGCRRGYT